jgi:transporter family protein
MTWLALSLLSAFFLGFYDVAKKAAVDRNAVLLVLFATGLSGLIFVAPAYVVTKIAPSLAARLGVEIASMSWHAHALVVVKAAIVTTSWTLTFFALRSLPISLASPVRASAPMLTVLGAVFFFGERLTVSQSFGIAITIAAYIGFSFVGRQEGIVFERSRAVWMLFAGTFFGAVSALYDKHLMQVAHLPAMAMQFWFTAYNTMLQGGLVLWIWAKRNRDRTPFQWRWAIPAVGVLLLVADALYFRALAIPGALVGVVSTVRRSNVIISFVVGGLAFHERNRIRKAVPLAGVLVGLYFLLR